MVRTKRRFFALAFAGAGILLSTTATTAAAAPAPITLGAIFPLQGMQSSLAQQEYRGVEIARDLVNGEGGVNGHPIHLDTRVVEYPSQVDAAAHSLAADRVPLVIGTYSSSLSIPASRAAAKMGLTYWEAGAVADQVTGRGIPGVFRIGANGATLGGNSAEFTASVLAARLHKKVSDVRISVVYENDAYGSSVAAAAIAKSRQAGMQIVSISPYNAYFPQWAPVASDLRSTHPDVIILASYVIDGAAFREMMLSQHIHAGALIGSTMAECYPDFGNILGPDAVGVFASDRPDGWVNYDLLRPDARKATDAFDDAWKEQTGTNPTEEGLAGFTAAWALFHYVLPAAKSLTPQGIATAAMNTVEPSGSLPNGGGITFSHDAADLGQNTSAIGVIWQWQATRKEVTVWPPQYAWGPVKLVPLPR